MIPPLGTAKQAALVENVSTIWSRQKVEMELDDFMRAKYKESKVKFRYAHVGVKVGGRLIVLLASRKLTENSLVVIEHVFDHWYIVCKEPS